MWASLTAVFVVTLVGIVDTVIWLAGNLVGFLQPILIPVAIALILAYLLDPLVTYLGKRGYGRTKAIGALFTIAFFALAAVLTWIVPSISMQSASVARELPAYTSRACEKVVDLIYRYNNTFGIPTTEDPKPLASEQPCQLVASLAHSYSDRGNAGSDFGPSRTRHLLLRLRRT